MSFLDSINKATNDKMKQIEKKASHKFREKARHATDNELYYNLRKYEDKGNYIAVEEIKRELSRRGLEYDY